MGKIFVLSITKKTCNKRRNRRQQKILCRLMHDTCFIWKIFSTRIVYYQTVFHSFFYQLNRKNPLLNSGFIPFFNSKQLSDKSARTLYVLLFFDDPHDFFERGVHRVGKLASVEKNFRGLFPYYSAQEIVLLAVEQIDHLYACVPSKIADIVLA